MSFSIDKKIHIRLWLSVGLITAMVLLSELLGEKEIIFPETAALVIGAWLSPRLPWETNRERMLLFMSLAAGAGYYLSAYIEAPLYLKIVVGMLTCMALVLISQTTMLPLISACILPILTEAENIIYPLSVIILTTIIIGVQIFLERKKLKKVHRYRPIFYDVKTEIIRWAFIVVLMAVMAGFAVWLDIRFIIAPPLIVMLCELTYAESRARKKPLQILLLTVLAAFAGAYARILFCGVLHCPLVLPALLVSALILYIMAILKIYFPPAGAIGILPLIIGEADLYLYPVQVLPGGIVFVTLAMLFGKLMERKSDKAKSLSDGEQKEITP